MFTRDERNAVLFLSVMAAAGGIVRVVRGPGEAPGSAAVAPEIVGEDIQKQAALARREAQLLQPLAPGETIDVDRATAREIERLPRVGPQLAVQIVERRRARGAFGSLEALDEVPGVGPSVLAAVRPFVRFSSPPRAVPQVKVREEFGRRRGTRAP